MHKSNPLYISMLFVHESPCGQVDPNDNTAFRLRGGHWFITEVLMMNGVSPSRHFTCLTHCRVVRICSVKLPMCMVRLPCLIVVVCSVR